MKKWKLWLISSVVISAAGCSDDNSDLVTPVQLTELATVTAVEPQTMLEVWNRVTNQPVGMISSNSLEGAQIGQRILVKYQAAVADTLLRPIPVSILGAAAIPYGEVSALSKDEIASYGRLKYEILSKWQTGSWLNFQMKVETGEDTAFTLVAYDSTLAADTVKCVFIATGLPEGNAFITRRTFASYNVAGILTRPGQTIKIITSE